jgi:hypothetical protein
MSSTERNPERFAHCPALAERKWDRKILPRTLQDSGPTWNKQIGEYCLSHRPVPCWPPECLNTNDVRAPRPSRDGAAARYVRTGWGTGPEQVDNRPFSHGKNVATADRSRCGPGAWQDRTMLPSGGGSFSRWRHHLHWSSTGTRLRRGLEQANNRSFSHEETIAAADSRPGVTGTSRFRTTSLFCAASSRPWSDLPHSRGPGRRVERSPEQVDNRPFSHEEKSPGPPLL